MNGDGPDFSIARRRMVEDHLIKRGISDRRIINAFLEVPRHLFVDPALGSGAYDNRSFPIGFSQTISQPYIQALMIQAVGVRSNDKVLEIGTGSGYQTAVLSLLAREVYSIERIDSLSAKAEEALQCVKTGRIRLKTGDGSAGWPYYSPFDRIIISAAVGERPETLLEQLSDNGTLIAPVSDGEEMLVLYRRSGGKIDEERLSKCSFVPLLKGAV